METRFVENIPKRFRDMTIPTRICPECQKPYQPTKLRQCVCSRDCARAKAIRGHKNAVKQPRQKRCGVREKGSLCRANEGWESFTRKLTIWLLQHKGAA